MGEVMARKPKPDSETRSSATRDVLKNFERMGRKEEAQVARRIQNEYQKTQKPDEPKGPS
jgi:hypothetical protein